MKLFLILLFILYALIMVGGLNNGLDLKTAMTLKINHGNRYEKL